MPFPWIAHACCWDYCLSNCITGFICGRAARCNCSMDHGGCNCLVRCAEQYRDACSQQPLPRATRQSHTQLGKITRMLDVQLALRGPSSAVQRSCCAFFTYCFGVVLLYRCFTSLLSFFAGAALTRRLADSAPVKAYQPRYILSACSALSHPPVHMALLYQPSQVLCSDLPPSLSSCLPLGHQAFS